MFKLIILLALCFFSSYGASSAWNDIETGKITPITSFSGNYSSSIYYYSQTHSLNTSAFQACLALISYNSILSTTFTFNTTILTKNSTTLLFTVQSYNTTYFNILSYHYLLSTHSTLDIKRLCYYTTSLYSGNGSRSIAYNNATTALSGEYLTMLTVFTGFKVENYQGGKIMLITNSTILNGTTTTNIYTDEYNLVEWVCVAVVVYNPKTTLGGEFYHRQTS